MPHPAAFFSLSYGNAEHEYKVTYHITGQDMIDFEFLAEKFEVFFARVSVAEYDDITILHCCGVGSKLLHSFLEKVMQSRTVGR